MPSFLSGNPMGGQQRYFGGGAQTVTRAPGISMGGAPSQLDALMQGVMRNKDRAAASAEAARREEMAFREQQYADQRADVERQRREEERQRRNEAARMAMPAEKKLFRDDPYGGQVVDKNMLDQGRQLDLQTLDANRMIGGGMANR